MRQLTGELRLLQGEEAARHLFGVAAGLESVVVGEPEIAGQVRRALNQAESTGAASPMLQRVFSDALQTRRSVRTRTGLGAALRVNGTSGVRVLASEAGQMDFAPGNAREREVLALMVEGLSNNQIADRLVLSVSTVKFHVSSILSKLGVESRVAAVTLAIQRHLVT